MSGAMKGITNFFSLDKKKKGRTKEELRQQIAEQRWAYKGRKDDTELRSREEIED